MVSVSASGLGLASTFGSAIKAEFATILAFEWVERRVRVTTAAADPLFEDLVTACANIGIPFQPDYNASPTGFGVSPFQFLIDEAMRRETSYSAFLGAAPPPNLVVAWARATGTAVSAMTWRT